MGAGHVRRIGAVEGAAVAPLMGGDAFAGGEDLDGAVGDADVDLTPDQWHQVPDNLIDDGQGRNRTP